MFTKKTVLSAILSLTAVSAVSASASSGAAAATVTPPAPPPGVWLYSEEYTKVGSLNKPAGKDWGGVDGMWDFAFSPTYSEEVFVLSVYDTSLNWTSVIKDEKNMPTPVSTMTCTITATATPANAVATFELLPSAPYASPTAMGGVNFNC
ncbi:hypothetical protein P7C73_g488, partial [Tremellales sp. Uapishka_1]